MKIRGTVRASNETRETLSILNLARTNRAILVDDRPSFLGMLRKAQNFITWGEPSHETVIRLIRTRGRLLGKKKITDEYAQKIGYKNLEELAEAVFNCNIEYWTLHSVNPFFRLHPPTKGFRGKVKKGYGMGGELGYRGEKINELLERMT